MASTYILFSQKADKYYTGSCKDFAERFKKHKSGEFSDSYTSKWNDWEKFLVINDLENKQAREMEKHIKKMKSRKYFHDLKKYPEMIERLKEKCK